MGQTRNKIFWTNRDPCVPLHNFCQVNSWHPFSSYDLSHTMATLWVNTRRDWEFEILTEASVYSENLFLPEISVARSLPVWTVASLDQFQPYWLTHLLSEEIRRILSFSRQPLHLSKFSHQRSLHRWKIYLLKHRCLTLCWLLRKLFSLGPMTLSQPLFLRPLFHQLGHSHWDLPSLQSLNLTEPRTLKRKS